MNSMISSGGTALRLRILGPIDVIAGGRSIKIGGPREHVVLATLAVRTHRVTSLDQLTEAVWGDDPPPTARSQIQSSISVLRKLFAETGRPDAIRTSPPGYLLDLDHEDLDSERFVHLVKTGHEEMAEGRTAEAAATLRTALDLWRGPVLDGVQSDYVRRSALVLDERRLTATEEHVRLSLELGRHRELVGELKTLLAEHPWREGLYGFLMLALYRCGRQADALEVWRRACAVFMGELGIEPRQELRDLEQAILNRDPSLDLSEAGGALDDGRSAAAAGPRQLPSSIADFIGRDEQLAEINRILPATPGADAARYAVPVIAISGRSGVGKSTLALRAAHELGDQFPDGHIYADLRGLTDESTTPALLARFIRALGVPGSAVPDGLAERIEMFRSRLADRRVLLVLDNVTGEEQVRPLLPGSPTCAVIVTSTARLVGVPGAHWIDVDTFDDATSREMLARIVGWPRVTAEPAPATELIEYCGGLPLALRIVGTRLASRPHWRIVELTRRLTSEVRRLDELSHHGLEMRSSIGLTYRSLPERAQRLFRLSSVIEAPDFAGWAAAVLLGTDLRQAEDTLEYLVDVQLLDAKAGADGRLRYSFHDLVRLYAHERLLVAETAEERDAALRRLLGAWLYLAERAHRREYGGDYLVLHGTGVRVHLLAWDAEEAAGSSLAWLETERVSLVSAVRQAADAGLAELCWDLALTLSGLLEVKGCLDDWREIVEVAYGAAARAGHRIGTAAMLYARGTLRIAEKRFDDAELLLRSALEIFDAERCCHGQALVLRNWAFIDRMRGDFGEMLRKYDSSLAKMRAVGDLVGEGHVLTSMAKFRIDEGELADADDLLSESMSLYKRVGYVRGEVQAGIIRSELYMADGRLGAARQALNDVLRTIRDIGDRIGEAYALYGLGVVRRREGRLDRAVATLEHALAVAEEVGDRLVEGQARFMLGEIAAIRADYPAALGHADRAAALFDQIGMTLWLAKALILRSEVHDETGRPESAKSDLDRARALLSRFGSRQSDLLLQRLTRGA
jgi:DNA-binding SARP family transcriptional activator/tetratricopeptide (TPR) repeat protein